MHLGRFFFFLIFYDLEELYYMLSWFPWLFSFIVFICDRKMESMVIFSWSSTNYIFCGYICELS
jgi:hypothetical protein